MHRCSAVAALIAFTVSFSATAHAADRSADIVGLRLGMTVDEARDAIRKYNRELAIQPPVEKIIKYRVGNQTRTTPPFLSYIFAVSGKKAKDDIYVYFSAPPGEPRVIAITRLHNNFQPPITRDVYREALVEKYGKPDAAEKDWVEEEQETRRSKRAPKL